MRLLPQDYALRQKEISKLCKWRLALLPVEQTTLAGRLPDSFADVAAARTFFGYFASRPKLLLLSEISLARLVFYAWGKLKTIQGLRIHLRLLLASN